MINTFFLVAIITYVSHKKQCYLDHLSALWKWTSPMVPTSIAHNL